MQQTPCSTEREWALSTCIGQLHSIRRSVTCTAKLLQETDLMAADFRWQKLHRNASDSAFSDETDYIEAHEEELSRVKTAWIRYLAEQARLLIHILEYMERLDIPEEIKAGLLQVSPGEMRAMLDLKPSPYPNVHGNRLSQALLQRWQQSRLGQPQSMVQEPLAACLAALQSIQPIFGLQSHTGVDAQATLLH